MRRVFFVLFFIITYVCALFAQNGNISVQSLMNTHVDTMLNHYLAGEGVQLSNGRFNNTVGNIYSDQIGYFQRNGFTQFPLASGLVMCTGNAYVAEGPNIYTGATWASNSSYVESSLYELSSNLNDCASLDFDFKTSSDTFVFRYVFASEEYCEYVNSAYNDIFAFFLTGPDPVTHVQTTRNIAIIPGSISASNPDGIPVAINNVNHGYHGSGVSGPGTNPSYSQYFIHNPSYDGTQFDGYTVALEAGSIIQACENYHMKLSICDVGDNLLDSGVFLEEHSFESTPEPSFTMGDFFCLHDNIVFQYQAQGVDSIHLITPSGDTLWTAPFVITNATEADSGYYFLRTKRGASCNGDMWTKDSIRIRIHVPCVSDFCSGLEYCAGETMSYPYAYDSVVGPWVTYINNNMFTIAPPATLTSDTSVLYTLSVYDENGCRFDTTVSAFIHIQPHTYIDSIVCNNCTWNGAIYTQSGTYTYTTQSALGCDSVVVLNLIVSPPVTATITGPTTLCADSSVVLIADSGYSYLWSTGDTTQSISVTEAGTYSLTFTNEFGCPAEASHQVTSMDNPIISVTVPEMCAGGSYTLSVGHQDNDNIHLGHGETTLSLTETIYLPDGVYCDPFGCSYRSPLTFTAYADDATIQSAEDIYYVRLNMEHSYIGDLYINITCPNGQKADLLKYSGSGLSNCTSQIPNSSRGWASGSNMPEYTYLGVAYDYDVASCDATAFGNEPGVGWNYCWSNNTTQGYGYAQGNDGLIYRYGNSHNGIVDSSNVAAGTQFYHPDDSFSNLIGCPLNGDWFIEVQDGWSQDNGYIFGWELALNSEALSDVEFELDHSTASGPWVTTLSDSLFQITPPAGLSHDTTIAYTFTVYDTGGCAYDTTVYITVHAIPHTYIDSIVCNSCTWNGAVYTQSGTYTYTTQSASGCDSVVVLNLIVSPPVTATITGLTTLCTDSAVTLTADSAYSYLWSTGDTTQVISVAMEGTYSLTVTNEYGCSAMATHQMTSMGNPIMSVTVPEMCSGGSYTLSVGHQDNDNIHLGHGETTLSLVDTIFLPDGIYCEPHGCSYRSPLTFTAYADDATIQSVEDIYYVKLNIEHSFIGDLYINITCPNGQKADLMKYGGSGNSQCNSQIVSSSRGWQSGSNMSVGTLFGDAYGYDVVSCDATDFGNEPGVGWNYCWSNNTTQGYVYAQGEGSLIYRAGNSHNGIVDSSNVAAGTQFYHPDDSFTSLIGCPLNGDWYIEVQDGWSADNGYIFGWELALSTEALPSMEFELDHSTASGPWLTTLSDSLFQITPPAGLSHDTTIAYTFTVYDTGGCAYDTTVYITVHAIPHTEIDTAVCDVLTYGGISYTVAGQYTQTYTNVFGCDSILTLNLSILPPTDSTLVVTVVENNLPYQLNGSPYTTSGTYTQHLDNAAGCDSLLTLVLTVLYNVTNAVDTTVCAANLPITWHGHVYTAAGTHTNVLTASNGVDSTVTYTLYVDELSASVGNVTHVVCYGAATGAATVAVTGGQSPLSYQWTTAAGTGISTTTSVSGCVAGNYTFTVTDQLGCTVTVPVTVNTLNDSMQPGTIASDQEVCSGNEIEAFTGTSAAGGDNSAYQWQISTNNTDWTPAPGNNIGQNYSYPNLSSESFWLRRAWISQSCGTVYSNTVMLTVLPVTHDTITVDVCQNNDYQGYGFEVPASEIEQPGEYVFERIQTTGPCDTFFVLLLTVHPEYSTDISDEICEGGGYFAHGFNIPAPATIDVEFLSQTLNLQSVHGCDSTVHLELSVTDTAIRIIPLTTDFCETMSAELMVETSMADYVWSTGEQAPTITVTQPGIYSVTASQGVCQATAHIRVENCQYELYLPNAITPSKGDGLNDYFSIPAYNQLGMDKFEISIFNRWGEQVFYSTDKNFKWNGEYRGQIHQEAIYNYIINYTDLTGKPHKVTGRITVL